MSLTGNKVIDMKYSDEHRARYWLSTHKCKVLKDEFDFCDCASLRAYYGIYEEEVMGVAHA